MRVIGIVGGVASGKSLVAEQLRRLGAVILDADRAGHEVLQEESVRRALRQRWGDDVFDDRGGVDRAAVAQIVFGPSPTGPQERAFLEQITHPRIGGRLREQVAAAQRAGAPVVVLDAPLLFEADWHHLCDQILFVESPREVRLQRARERGWTDDQFCAREAAQVSVEEKRRRSDQVIDNGGSLSEVAERVRRWWRAEIRSAGDDGAS